MSELSDRELSDRELLIRIDERTTQLHENMKGINGRVDELESARDKAHGVMWMLGAAWAALEAIVHLRRAG